MSEDAKHSTRVAIISALVSLALSIIAAAFIVGQRTGKILDIEKWRENIAPKIERMDSVGSLAFDHWKASHDKESDQWKATHGHEHERVEAKLKELDNRVRELERK